LAAPPEEGIESWQRGWTRSILVRLQARCGVEGFGIAESQPDVVAAVIEAEPQASFSDESVATMGGLRSLALGESAARPVPLWHRLYEASLLFGRRGAALQAISAIDIACFDLVARYLGMGVSELLGGRFRETLPAYGSAVLPDREDEARSLGRYVADSGFSALKVGWGAFRAETDTIISLIEVIRSELPSGVRLIFDIGFERRRTAKEVLQLVRELESYRPLWIEEPCHPDDVASYSAVTREALAPIAAGEACATIHDFTPLIDAGVEILQPDLSRCGGFSVARQVAARAREAGRLTIPHAWQNDLLVAATLHFCATLPDTTFVEYSLARGALRDICRPQLELVDGSLTVPTGPGLGLAPDPNLLERYRRR
jgi:L-alanine-DL-glutamate epimerase-like enolase superfamily enzyme